MKENGRMRVVVRSERVPVTTISVPRAIYSQYGVKVGTTSTRSVVFENILDEGSRLAVEEARKLSASLGLELEVVDRSTTSIFQRAASAITRSSRPFIILQVSSRSPAAQDRSAPSDPKEGPTLDQVFPSSTPCN